MSTELGLAAQLELAFYPIPTAGFRARMGVLFALNAVYVRLSVSTRIHEEERGGVGISPGGLFVDEILIRWFAGRLCWLLFILRYSGSIRKGREGNSGSSGERNASFFSSLCGN